LKALREADETPGLFAQRLVGQFSP